MAKYSKEQRDRAVDLYIRTLRRRRDIRARLSQQGDAAGVVPGTP